MHLMFYLDSNGNRVYTMKKEDPSGAPTLSAHPGGFYLPDIAKVNAL